MMGKLSQKITLAVLAGISSLVIGGTAANAGSAVLGTSGWTANWDSAFDNVIGISTDHQSSNSVYIEKHVNFTTAFNNSNGFIDPAVITFTANGDATPAQYIVINDEGLTNNTGSNWNGFRMTLLPSNGSVSFDPVASDINPPGSGFSISPFTSSSFSLNNSVLDLTGGVVANGTPWYPGTGDGALVINTNAALLGNQATFTLKEQPLAIPLPAAVWSGLGGLVGLALVGSRKKLRQLIA